jgi:hypothetical protein
MGCEVGCGDTVRGFVIWTRAVLRAMCDERCSMDENRGMGWGNPR